MSIRKIYTQIPEKFEILNGKYKRTVLKRGMRAYVILQEGAGGSKHIVMERRLQGTREVLSDYQRYKMCDHPMQADLVFMAIEQGEIVF